MRVLGIVRPPTMATSIEIAHGASCKGRDVNTVAVAVFVVVVWFRHLALRRGEDMARWIWPPGGHGHCWSEAKVEQLIV